MRFNKMRCNRPGKLDLLLKIFIMISIIYITNCHKLYHKSFADTTNQLGSPQNQIQQQNTSSTPNSSYITTQNGQDQFGYLDDAKEETNKSIKKRTNVDTLFLHRAFLSTKNPIKDELVVAGMPYRINWKKNKSIPVNIIDFSVFIGKGTPQTFERIIRLTLVSATSDSKPPIEFTIPSDLPDGQYSLEFVGNLEPGGFIAGPQYSQPFILTHKVPGKRIKVTNSIKHIMPGTSGTYE